MNSTEEILTSGKNHTSLEGRVRDRLEKNPHLADLLRELMETA